MIFPYISQLKSALEEAREIVRYYRNGPLGDVAAANGKIVEEALRKTLTDAGHGPVTTTGLVDLGVAQWDVGFQVKTYRKKSNQLIFARSDKKTKAARIADIKARVGESLEKSNAHHLLLLNIDMFTSDFGLYSLGSVLGDGSVITYGSFLQEDHVQLTLANTHFRILKTGLHPIFVS